MRNLVLSIALLLSSTQVLAGFSTRGGKVAPMSVAVQFSSIGTGVDQHSVHSADSLVQRHQRLGVVTQVQRIPWGREGELTLCVTYNNLQMAYEAEQEFKAATAKAWSPVQVRRVFGCENLE